MISVVVALALSTTPAAAKPAAASADAAGERKICRKFAETGSFVRRTKQCRTAAEWRRIEQDARETGREMQTRISTQQGG